VTFNAGCDRLPVCGRKAKEQQGQAWLWRGERSVSRIEIPVSGTWYSRPADDTGQEWEEVAKTPATVSLVPGRLFRLKADGCTTDEELAALAHLPGLSALHELILEDCKGITDAGLVLLARLAGLQVLSLNNTGITDAGLVHLRGLTGLRQLGLSHGFCRITDAGLAHLRRLAGLQVLDLGFNDVADAGLDHLMGMPGLQVLGLACTKVSDAGLPLRVANCQGPG
jgi:hypothetical protein